MVPFAAFWFWLEGLGFAVAIRESQWLFPFIEILHVVTLVTMVGTIALLDFRILGAGLRDRSVAATAREILPWTWGTFAATSLTGLALFSSAASYYLLIPAFQLKVLFLLLAAANMLVLHFSAWREHADWSEESHVPLAVKAAAGISLLCWSGVVIAGRWTGFY